MDRWLAHRAYKNHKKDFSRVFVVCTEQNRVVAYYALSSYAIERKALPNLEDSPDPIPAVLLGRLAVDSAFQKNGLGSSLVQDALLRILSAKQNIGIKAIIVHALNDKAAKFYKTLGFEDLGRARLELFITVADLEETFANL